MFDMEKNMPEFCKLQGSPAEVLNSLMLETRRDNAFMFGASAEPQPKDQNGRLLEERARGSLWTVAAGDGIFGDYLSAGMSTEPFSKLQY